jgi:hypothetical protein
MSDVHATVQPADTQDLTRLRKLERLSSYVEASSITMIRKVDALNPEDLTADRLHEIVAELYDEIVFLRSVSHHTNNPSLATTPAVRDFFDRLQG